MKYSLQIFIFLKSVGLHFEIQLLMFVKIIIRQSEKIIKQEKKIERLKEENNKLKSFKDKFEKIIENARINKENYFITFEKINNELDQIHMTSSKK